MPLWPSLFVCLVFFVWFFCIQERVDYLGYANFQGHVLDWGIKMVLTKVITPVQLLSYQVILASVSEEWGGARTAYYYDLLLRQELAKELERGGTDVQPFLATLHRDVLADARRKVEVKAQESARDVARSSGTRFGSGKGSKDSKGSKGSKGNKGGWDRSRSPRAAAASHQNGQRQPQTPPAPDTRRKPSWENGSYRQQGSGKGGRW